VADDRTLEFVRDLKRADSELAEALAEFERLAAGVDELGTRAHALHEFQGGFSSEHARLEAEHAEAGGVLAAARDELTAAAHALEEARRDAAREAAARTRSIRAHDAARMAERRLDERDAELRRLEAEAADADREVAVLEERAGELAAVLGGLPRVADEAAEQPGPGLADLADWATKARASLFVARAGVAVERTALVRQAEEAGAVALGEPLVAGSAADVERLLERRRS
jgi:chromosome segregation ATPase